MSFFKGKLDSKVALIHIFVVVLFLGGLLFGCFYYYSGDTIIVDTLDKLFFINREGVTNDYDLYILITAIYIFASLCISTSFIGVLFNSFIIFTKSMQISLATIYLFSEMQLSIGDVFLCYVPQLIIELALLYVISIISIKLSINSFVVAFVVQDNYNTKKIINYILDYLIVILIILTVSMLFRVYLI